MNFDCWFLFYVCIRPSLGDADIHNKHSKCRGGGKKKKKRKKRIVGAVGKRKYFMVDAKTLKKLTTVAAAAPVTKSTRVHQQHRDRHTWQGACRGCQIR